MVSGAGCPERSVSGERRGAGCWQGDGAIGSSSASQDGGGRGGVGGVRGWLARPGSFAAGVSLLAHAVLLLVLAVTFLDPPPAVVGRPADDAVELAVLTESELSAVLSGASVAVPSLPAPPEPEVLEPVRLDPLAAPDDLLSVDSGELSALSNAGAPLEDALDSVVDAASARFFGVEARGSRFAYVVDISGSMTEDRMAAMRVQLEASLGALLGHTHYSVVLYNSVPRSLTGPRWVRSDDSSKRRTISRLRAVEASGGTEPIGAFREVFGLRPRPDAIYFMTDGRFADPPVVVSEIARLNEQGLRRTPIHCITFVDRSAEADMRAIAGRSGGTYTHVGGGVSR